MALIKQAALAQYLARSFVPIYILIGQDSYLLNQAAETIRHNWQQKKSESETTIFYLNSPADWSSLEEKTSNYCLFSQKQLIDARYDKKNLETPAKNFFSHYLQQSNEDCLLLIRAPNLAAKQLQPWINNPQVLVVQVVALTDLAMESWITNQLKEKQINFEKEVPRLIQQYTKGNMLASVQVLQKIELVLEENQCLTLALCKEQLVDQCDYQLFELSDACLSGQLAKAIHLLRFAAQNGEEPSLILWILAQDLRQLIQLKTLLSQKISFSEACQQLKIWSQRANFYQTALRRVELEQLLQLLKDCKKIDENIKTNQSFQIWQAMERIALALCLKKEEHPVD